jgi:hypothetical protein
LTTKTEEPDMTKLLSMTENVEIRDRVYDSVRKTDAENREYGRLHKSICDLAKEIRKFCDSFMKEDE